jgi:hypothetical protein
LRRVTDDFLGPLHEAAHHHKPEPTLTDLVPGLSPEDRVALQDAAWQVCESAA